MKSLGPMNLDDAAIISFNRIDIDDDSPDLGFKLRVQSRDDMPWSRDPTMCRSIRPTVRRSQTSL
jgi:hypothetical protein